MLVREREIIPPRGSTHVETGDHVFVVMRGAVRPLVDRVFRRQREPAAIPAEVEFPLRGDTTVAELREFYDVVLEEASAATLHDVLTARLGADLEEGARLRLQDIDLVVRSFDGTTIDRVGLVIHAGTGPSA